MGSYCFCDLTVASTVPLPELAATETAPPDLTFRLRSEDTRPPEGLHWIHHWRWPDGQVSLSCARQGTGYLLRFPGLADFSILGDGVEIDGFPLGDTPPETIRHLLLDQVLPRVLSHRGKLVIHASAVSAPAGAIAFLGESGWGKSTLAAGVGGQGSPPLADDCLLLDERGERWWGIPAYAGLRLWPDSIAALFAEAQPVSDVAHYSEKKRLMLSDEPGRVGGSPAPLKAIYVLASPEDAQGAERVEIARLSKPSAFIALVKSTFLLDITDRSRLRTHFAAMTGAVSALPFFSLLCPREHSFLPQVREAVLESSSCLR